MSIGSGTIAKALQCHHPLYGDRLAGARAGKLVDSASAAQACTQRPAPSNGTR